MKPGYAEPHCLYRLTCADMGEAMSGCLALLVPIENAAMPEHPQRVEQCLPAEPVGATPERAEGAPGNASFALLV
ncbi:MAG: hypothetical protein AB1768_16205 [Pseudomonadota bacterium]|jgi:hypothetical protein